MTVTVTITGVSVDTSSCLRNRLGAESVKCRYVSVALSIVAKRYYMSGEIGERPIWNRPFIGWRAAMALISAGTGFAITKDESAAQSREHTWKKCILATAAEARLECPGLMLITYVCKLVNRALCGNLSAIFKHFRTSKKKIAFLTGGDTNLRMILSVIKLIECYYG